MTCVSSYFEVTKLEQKLRETEQLCVFVANKRNILIPSKIIAASKDIYVRNVGQVEWLCEILRSVKQYSEREFDELVYNAKDANSRQLANWWEEHEAADEARERKEAEDARQQAEFERVANFLDPTDLVILLNGFADNRHELLLEQLGNY